MNATDLPPSRRFEDARRIAEIANSEAAVVRSERCIVGVTKVSFAWTSGPNRCTALDIKQLERAAGRADQEEFLVVGVRSSRRARRQSGGPIFRRHRKAPHSPGCPGQ